MKRTKINNILKRIWFLFLPGFNFTLFILSYKSWDFHSVNFYTLPMLIIKYVSVAWFVGILINLIIIFILYKKENKNE